MDFETLMAQATAVARRQDAALAERARQRRREEDEQRRKEEKLRRAREEQQQMLASVREESERRQQKLLQEKRQQRQAERQKSSLGRTKSSVKKTVPGGGAGSQANLLTSARQSGKRDAQLSFDELMAKAKAMPSSKSAAASNASHNTASSSTTTRPTISGKRLPPSSSSSSLTAAAAPSHTQHPQQQQQQRNTPAIFHKKRPLSSSSTAASGKSASSAPSTISAKDRIRQMYHGPPQKVNATKKRDARSVSQIHRDIRHSRGVYSDDEDSRTDPRLLRNKQMQATRPTTMSSQYKQSRPADIVSRPRMPFQRPPERMRRPMPQKRSYDEVDEDLESFIVDDEEDENDYSAEISRIFRYNKSKYADDMYSDDDMEADSREVLREERRSERIGRREDIEEERKELERLKRIKLKGKSRA
ncbi:SPT2 chromatin protein-domain-containing protein [Dichotomocladium elegans]|nr:SPT2 chromatin protein-domain-containing protein [Dichotomocladium elegans]